MLAGLLRTDDSKNDQGIPGLSDLPLIGRLFSNKTHTSAHTDVILTLTPHIIRNAQIAEEDLLPIWVGTEANVSFRGTSTRAESETEGPFEGNEGTPEEIQDAIRRRIQRLPRGLRDDEGGTPQPQPPGGQPPPQADGAGDAHPAGAAEAAAAVRRRAAGGRRGDVGSRTAGGRGGGAGCLPAGGCRGGPGRGRAIVVAAAPADRGRGRPLRGCRGGVGRPADLAPAAHAGL